MAGKNTAVFAIYPARIRVEHAVDACGCITSSRLPQHGYFRALP
jgi:hypothetical protein